MKTARSCRLASRGDNCTPPTSSRRPTDGIVIVDQHAAHERLVYERMKKAQVDGSVARQPLLIPEVVELEPSHVARIADRAGDLAECGLVIESFGPDAVLVREVPALLGTADLKLLIRDLADRLDRDKCRALPRRKSSNTFRRRSPVTQACARGVA